VRIVRALAGYSETPFTFPILISGNMSINEPAFVWVIELAIIPRRSHSLETTRTYSEHLHEWFDALEQSGMDWRVVGETDVDVRLNRIFRSG
jgi:integrase/recombinase XerD